MQQRVVSIDQQLNAAVASQVAKNREKLHPIVKTFLLCGRQNLALRGRRKDECSKNPGNFKALNDFRVDGGEVLKNHLVTAPKKSH